MKTKLEQSQAKLRGKQRCEKEKKKVRLLDRLANIWYLKKEYDQMLLSLLISNQTFILRY